MARTIKFKAQCYKCKNWFEKGRAYLQRVKGVWKCHCFECYKSKKLKPSKAMEKE